MWALLILSASSGCVNSRTSPDALADALEAPLRRCAGSLAGEDMAAAREQCLPVVAVYQAVTGR